MAKKVKKLLAQKPSQDIKFDSSLIIVLLAALILLISFLVYSNYGLKTLTEEPEEIIFGDECTADLDCQPRCPGTKGVCYNGYCMAEEIAEATVRCIDLQSPVCGNSICEGDEATICTEDCVQ